MSEKKAILYIGNKLSKLSRKSVTVTSIETLGKFLSDEGYRVYTASSRHYKLARFIDMLLHVVSYSREVSVVLIDTYSTLNFYYAVAVGNVCRLLRVTYVPILRGGDLPNRLRKNKALCWKLFNGAKTNVAPSLYLMEAFKQEGYTNLTYIPNTIEIDRYDFKLRQQPAAKLLWVRSFAEIYNPMMALHLVEKLMQQDMAVELCMVGPEKDRSYEQCRSYAEANELPVTFTGKLDKQDWIALSSNYDIFINTTNFDNTPVSVIEAMALGLPVVSTRVGGIPFLLSDGQDSLLVPPDDVDAMKTAVCQLIGEPDLAVKLTRAAREKVEAFDWNRVKHSWNSLLND